MILQQIAIKATIDSNNNEKHENVKPIKIKAKLTLEPLHLGYSGILVKEQ